MLKCTRVFGNIFLWEGVGGGKKYEETREEVNKTINAAHPEGSSQSKKGAKAMIGKNRQLVTDEPVEYEK